MLTEDAKSVHVFLETISYSISYYEEGINRAQAKIGARAISYCMICGSSTGEHRVLDSSHIVCVECIRKYVDMNESLLKAGKTLKFICPIKGCNCMLPESLLSEFAPGIFKNKNYCKFVAQSGEWRIKNMDKTARNKSCYKEDCKQKKLRKAHEGCDCALYFCKDHVGELYQYLLTNAKEGKDFAS